MRLLRQQAVADLLWWAEHMTLGDERWSVDLADTDEEADRRFDLIQTMNDPTARLAWFRAALAAPTEPTLDARDDHWPTLIFEDGDGDFVRCSCGEQGFDFEQGRRWFADHITARLASQVREQER